MRHRNIIVFIALAMIFITGCSNKKEQKEFNTYENTVIYEVDRLQQSAEVWQQELGNPQITRAESVEYSAALVEAYKNIVRYIELQPQPKTKKTQQLHFALLSAMKEILIMQNLQNRLWEMMSQNIEPSQEFMDSGMKQKIIVQEKMNQYRELLKNK